MKKDLSKIDQRSIQITAISNTLFLNTLVRPAAAAKLRETTRQAEDDHLLGVGSYQLFLSKAVLVISEDAGPQETKACKCLCEYLKTSPIKINKLYSPALSNLKRNRT